MVSMKDVAREAGVSVSTVSHVLNKTRHVVPDTVSRVQKAIDQLGYEPSSLARALKTNRSQTLGMLVPGSTNPFFADVLKGVEEACYHRGYSLILCHSDQKAARQQELLKTLIKKRVDALIVMTTHDDPDFDAQLSQQQKLPMVVLDAETGNIGCTISDNSKLGGRLAITHLLESDFRRIACLTGPENHPRSRERLTGVKEALDQVGLDLSDIQMETGELTIEGGHRAMAALLARTAPASLPEAVFAFNDLMAMGALRALHEQGLKVPQDISLMGYDDLELARYLTPALTTIRQPSLALGEQAASVLIRHLEEKAPLPEALTLTPELVVRESVKTKA